MLNRRSRMAIQDQGDISVPDSVVRRVAQVPAGTERLWIDQTLYLIGHNATHHRPGDPLLDEAIHSAHALLALLVQMRRYES